MLAPLLTAIGSGSLPTSAGQILAHRQIWHGYVLLSRRVADARPREEPRLPVQHCHQASADMVAEGTEAVARERKSHTQQLLSEA